MYELMIKDSFSAAHNLRDYEGKCEHVHGHNYIVEACFIREKLEKNGLAVDFSVLKKALKSILDKLDHKYLNEDLEYFKKHNTSAENIAKYIYDLLKKEDFGAAVSKVSVWESEDAKATYFE